MVDLSALAGKTVRLRFYHWFDFRSCNAVNSLCGAICAIENTTYSGGIVEATSNGTTWQKVSPLGGYTGKAIKCASTLSDGGKVCGNCALDGVKGFDGASGGWLPVELDVSSFATKNFQFRFHFASYDTEFLCHPNKAGWYIDDVSLVKLQCP